MPDLTFDEIAAFTAVFEPLNDALALALSESINQGAMFDVPTITQHPIDSLMADPSPVLQTTFSYPVLSSDEGVLVFREQDGAVFADLRDGGTGENPPAALLDEDMNRLADAMSGVVQGFGMSLGNTLNLPLQPGPCATAIGPLTLPPSFAISGLAVRIEIHFHIDGVMDSVLRLYLTADMVRAIAPVEGAAAADFDVMAGGAQGGDFRMPVAGAGAFKPLDMSPGTPEPLPRGMDMLMDIPLEVSVELGRVQMLIKDVLELSAGSIVELERVAGEPVDLLVNGRLVAKGEVVVIEDNFGIRVTEIVSPADRLNGLSKK